MAALIARAELDVAGHVALGHYTHEKNPVGAAAALATLREIDTRGLVGRAATLGARALADLEALADAHACVAEVRGQGLVLGVELAGPQAVALAERTLYAALARGLSFKVSGGTVLTLMPPLTLTDDEWKRALDILDDSLRAAEEGTA
jgi:4-aminobutyrate aminotransferase